MSKYFERQLEELHVQLITLGSYCEKAISFSAKAIQKVQNEEIARQVFETDRDIDAKEREIENLCLSLLLHQHPVARDLREISAALKMVSDMERIGDQAADIADLSLYVAKNTTVIPETITQMAEDTVRMVTESVDAFVKSDLERARVFAQKYEVKKAYGSYEEMLADDEVGLVYIATPHSHHYLHAKMCLEAGKHVLCEKAFTVNAEQAQKLFDLAKEKKLLITEAIWTRYMPSRKMINDIIESGVIGEVTAVTANLSYTVSHVERIRKPELAGGALLDVGVYPINFASMVLGDKVKDVKATAIFQNGVDILDSIAMVFEGDRMATLQCGAREISDRMGSIFGTRGYMQVQNINNPEKITVFDTEHKEVASYVVPEQISGYEYEVESCMKAIHEGKTECPEMPHAETIRIMKIMDDIRKSWNYEIPCIE